MSTITKAPEANLGPFEPRYDLSMNQMQGAVDDFINSQEWPEGRFFSTIVGPDSPISNVARTTERIVFEETFGNDTKVMAEEYGPYEEASSFIVAIDQKSHAFAGVERVVSDSPSGLKSLNDAPQYIGKSVEEIRRFHGISDLSTCRDIGTLAVPVAYRGLRTDFIPSTLIYRTFFLDGDRRGIEHVVAMIDSQARKGVDTLGVPLKNMHDSGSFPYLGSPVNYAVHGEFPTFEKAVNDQARRHAQKVTAQGFIGRVLHPKKAIFRATAERVTTRLATGKDLDDHIVLPEL